MSATKLRDSSNEANRWCVAPAESDDIPLIQSLFERVFKQPMSDSFWHWKYGQNNGMSWVAKRGAKLIAHYGGIKREVFYKGLRRQSIQCVDTMVDRSERGSLSRKGPYFLVASGFLNQYVGTDRPFEFGYGFPNARVMRLGELLGIQASVGQILEPVWSPTEGSVCRDVTYDRDDARHRLIANQLNVRLQASLCSAIVGVRDADYLSYRYFDNPNFDYQIKIVWRYGSSEPLGIVVFRIESDRLLVLDLIASADHFSELVAQLRVYCGRAHAFEMSAWISSIHLPLLGQRWGRLDDPQVRIPTSICTPGPTPTELKDKWYLTAGDTDFK